MSHEKLIHPQSAVRAECGVSQRTWYRWKQDGVIPGPDVEVSGRPYYSAQRRKQLISALIGEGGAQ